MKRLLAVLLLALALFQLFFFYSPSQASMPTFPKVTTLPPNGITETSAVLHGVVYDMAPPVYCGMVSFVWGTTPGVYPNKTTPQMTTDNGTFSATVTGLTPGTRYYVRALIERCAGTWLPSINSYGAGIGFNRLDLRAVAYGVGCEYLGNEISFTTDIRSATASTNLGNVVFSINTGTITGLRAVTPACGASGFAFPYGMFSFNIGNLVPGQAVNVIIKFPNALPADIKYYKCINGAVVDCSSIMTRLDDRTIMLTITDGGKGDADGIANGMITDPGGPAFSLNIPQSSSAQMPSVSQSPVQLSNITVKSASISASAAAPGSPVTVTAEVANNGLANGTAMIKVYVNGQEECSRGVTVNSGSVSPVTYTVSRNEPGTYSVYVGGVQAGSFTVARFNADNVILFI